MLLQSWIVTGDMLDPCRFRDAGAGDQCGLGRSIRFSDRLEKGLVLEPVANPDRVRLVMNVDMRVDWPHHRAIRFVRAETKDAGPAMIDPYDAMILSGQGFFPAFSLSVETTGKSPPSSLNAKSFVAAVAMMMVVVMMVMMMMVAITVMVMVVMLHRHRLGRSGERRQGECGSQNGGGKKCPQHGVSFLESLRPAWAGGSWSELETDSSGHCSKMSFFVVASFRLYAFHFGRDAGFSMMALSTDRVSAA